MTKGKLVLLTDDSIYVSVEFNGDMFYRGHGRRVLELLYLVNSVEDFERCLKKFNAEAFQYPYDEYDDDSYDCGLIEKHWFRFLKQPLYLRESYNYHWSSDYLYIRNISGFPVSVFCKRMDIEIENNQTGVFYFGDLPTSPVFYTEMEYAFGNIPKEHYESLALISDEERKELEVSGIDTNRVVDIYANYEAIGISEAKRNCPADYIKYIDCLRLGKDTIEDDDTFDWKIFSSGRIAKLICD